MSNYVFVVDTNKQHQNPIHPAQARLLLNQGQAAVYRHYPFTQVANLGDMAVLCCVAGPS